MFLLFATPLTAADLPTFRHDAARRRVVDVLKEFDIVVRAGFRQTAVVFDVESVDMQTNLVVELVAPSAKQPLLCGLEIRQR